MAITNANQMIDIKTINDGCTIIERAAEDYLTCAERVLESAEICSPEALSVDKTSMQPTLLDLGNSIKQIKTNIETLTTQIRSAATEIYAQQSSQLAEYEQMQASSQNGN